MTEETGKPLKIIHFIAENVKKLRVVEIKPDGQVVKIAGRNDQGKTTVLDSIFMALDHTRVASVMPIRKGENKARIRLVLGNGETAELIVERRFGEKTSSLIVENAKGARFNSPQKMLDALIGELSFDPLAFTRMPSREQFDELRRVSQLDVDIEELDRLNAGDFGKRTDLNREAKQKRAQADGIVLAVGLPDEPLDEAALLAEMETAASENSELEQRKARREQATRDISDKLRAADSAAQRAAQLRAQMEAAETEAQEHRRAANELAEKLTSAPALPDPVDVSGIRVKIEHARQVNAKIEARTRKAALVAEAELVEGRAQECTDRMAAREKAKAAAIAAAKMPVDGLGFGAGDKPFITYQGIPFEQCSRSVKLKVSMAIAMAANPKLRVIRIEDASVLDKESMEQVAEMAKNNDFQVWMELVQDDGKVGIIIEDGAVVSTPESRAAETA